MLTDAQFDVLRRAVHLARHRPGLRLPSLRAAFEAEGSAPADVTAALTFWADRLKSSR